VNWDPYQREVLAELGLVLYRAIDADTNAFAGAAPEGAASTDSSANEAAMLARLARAAGVSVGSLPSDLHQPGALACLRGDAAAKRALWPRLRALRARPQ